MSAGVGDGFHVQPDGLVKVGDELSGLSDQIEKVAEQARAAAEPVAGLGRGWAAVQAFQECAEAWGQHLRGAAERARAAGDRLKLTASKYAAADDLARMTFHRVLRDLGGQARW
ncbi:hypothetical protein TH66_18325 [Carbonactinospora thermoautotrophica]|nr:type VII secretion target [Carbonactinospora thermoautotrophica]KWW97550.1 hypothetical protein TH66_18325 [Carbonactinospora thermoautotrophica]